MPDTIRREVVRVANWETLQARTDKNLPWFRVYHDLRTHPEWMALSFHMKGCLTEIWCAACEHGNEIPGTLSDLVRLTSIRKQDVNLLAKNGLVYEDSIEVERKQFKDLKRESSDKSQTKTKTETKINKKTVTNPVDNVEKLGAIGGQLRHEMSLEKNRSGRPSVSVNGRKYTTDQWEALNGEVVKVATAYPGDESAIVKALQARHSEKRIRASIKKVRERGWIQ